RAGISPAYISSAELAHSSDKLFLKSIRNQKEAYKKEAVIFKTASFSLYERTIKSIMINSF
ncbi:MAG: hypothetical protein NC548_44995, partial [Lachnospiraceae bacterium]|nr:hypothetical protein [Lachnospiraceae bacterium]